MKATQEIINNANNMERLVESLKYELDLSRNIAYRYMKKYGAYTDKDVVDVPNSISFGIYEEGIYMRDLKTIPPMKSSYEKILELI